MPPSRRPSSHSTRKERAMHRSAPTTPQPRRITVATLAALALVTGACGSRLNERALDKAEGPFRPVSAVAASQGEGTAGQARPGADTVGATGADISAGTGVTTTAPIGATAIGPTSGRSGGVGSTTPNERSSAGSSSVPPQRMTGSATATPAPAAAGTAAANSAQGVTPAAPGVRKSEILLGSFGTEAGVLGAVSGSAPPAIRAWAAYVNAQGGINGHPVRVILGEDNADPARTLSIVRRMVEQDKVIGFFNDYSFTLASVLPYLEEKQIPVIGSIGGDASGDHSPMMFNPLTGS